MEDTVYLLIERITSIFRTDKPVTSLLILDISDAFDNVFYERLLYNLRKKRVPAEVINWIKGFFN